MIELDESHKSQINCYVLQGSTLSADKPRIMPDCNKWARTKALPVTLKVKGRDSLYF